MDVRNTTFPLVEEVETILKIDSTQRRIEIMVQMKNEMKKSIQPLIKNTENESVQAKYNELYAQMDEVIAKDAKFLVEISEQKPPKI